MIARSDSILFRIIWLHITAIGIAAIAVPLASYLLLSSTAASFENQTLRAHAAEIAKHLRADGPGWRLDLPDDIKTFYVRGFDGFAFSIVDASGKLVASSRSGNVPILPARQISSMPSYFQKREGKAVYYGASIPETIDGRLVWIEIAQDLEHPDVILDDVVSDFLPRVLWLTIPIMLVLLLADIFVVRRALKPVLLASDRAHKIDPSRLDVRVPAGNLPAEIRPLVVAFNQVLDRLEQGFRMQREFTADAAHELRTPLSVLRARTEWLSGEPAAEQMRHDVDVMTRIVNQLLDVADLESRSIDLSEMLDLRSVCQRVVDYLSPIAEREDKRMVLSGASEPVLVRGDAELLFQALRNLAENAVRLTPRGAAVEIWLGEDGTVRVLDEGPGVPESERELIFQRFWRRDRGRADGAGLGLSIASRIISAHGGTIAVTNRDPAGAAFEVSFKPVTAD